MSQNQGGVRATPLKLRKRMDAEQAFRRIAANCREQIAANQPLVAGGAAPEALHQMRVGLRRLGSALRLYRDALALPQALQQELDWLQDQLGPARDWDVLAAATLPRIAARLPDNLEVLLARLAAESRADDMRVAAAQAVRTERYAELMRNLHAWLDARAWRETCTDRQLRLLAQPAAAFADAQLAGTRKRLLRRGKKLGRGKVRARDKHRARIAAKRARYAAEFFQSLARRGAADYIDALAALQDELGWQNDAHVADGLLRQLQKDEGGKHGSADFARGCVASALRGCARRGKRGGKLGKLWRAFGKRAAPRTR